MSEPANLSIADLPLLMNELKEVTDPHRLGIDLGIQSYGVTTLLKNAKDDINRQKSDVVEHWLKNDSDSSWKALVKTLRNIDHVRLANRLERTYINIEAKGDPTACLH